MLNSSSQRQEDQDFLKKNVAQQRHGDSHVFGDPFSDDPDSANISSQRSSDQQHQGDRNQQFGDKSNRPGDLQQQEINYQNRRQIQGNIYGSRQYQQQKNPEEEEKEYNDVAPYAQDNQSFLRQLERQFPECQASNHKPPPKQQQFNVGNKNQKGPSGIFCGAAVMIGGGEKKPFEQEHEENQLDQGFYQGQDKIKKEQKPESFGLQELNQEDNQLGHYSNPPPKVEDPQNILLIQDNQLLEAPQKSLKPSQSSSQLPSTLKSQLIHELSSQFKAQRQHFSHLFSTFSQQISSQLSSQFQQHLGTSQNMMMRQLSTIKNLLSRMVEIGQQNNRRLATLEEKVDKMSKE